MKESRIITKLKDLVLWLALRIFGRNINLATKWNQLTELQLCEISAALDHFHKFRECHPPEFQPVHYSRLYVNLVKNLLRTNNFIKVWIALRQIPPETYKEHVGFLISEIARTKFLPEFKFRNKLYFPPADRLQNLTIKEFSFVDSLYFNWRKTNDNRYLDMLFASLYRPAGTSSKENDPRRSFDKYFIEQDVLNLMDIPTKKKIAVAYCYEGSRNYIVKQYPQVFPKPPKQDPKDKVKPAQYTPFGKLLHFKIQFDPSKLESTQNLNVHDFFGPYENELIEMKNKK